MNKLSALLFISFAAIGTVAAQSKLHPTPKVVEFADNPVMHMVPPEYYSEPAVIVQHDVTMDYKYEGRGVNVYYTLHNVVKVLDEKGIASYNTIGIPVGSRTRVPLIRARTISPNGKVHDIAKEMIKVTQDEYGRHKIVIAMEGVEKNSEIELLLKEIRPFSVFGNEFFQFSVPVLEGHLSISYPKDFVFEEKGYNGFPNVQDALQNNRRHLDVSMNDIPGLQREPYSFYDVHRMRAEWRINHFTDMNENDFHEVYTWDEMARKVFDANYKITDKERAAVNAYLTELGVHPKGDEESNIRKIENGIKNNIVLYGYVEGENADVLDSIITHRAATSSGYVKLFAACLTQAEVKHELGMAGDHSEYRFDTKFENWDNLDYHVFYFPNQKKFLYPASIYYRYPVVPDMLVNSKGVFCNIPPKGIVTGGLADIRTITPLPAAASQSNLAAGISFSDDMDPRTEVSYSFTGNAAAGLRQQIINGTKSKEEDLVKKIVTFAERPSDIEKYTISNEDLASFNDNKPLEITATVNAPFLVTRAGKQYLFKIGEIIGDQAQIYSEKKRVLPVDMAYPHSMNRTITVNLPKGCKLKNPEALLMQAEYVDKNMKSLISFKSDYALMIDEKNGDKLVVTISENYPQTHFAVADYERFKEVVNTAADFDKIVLLLEKKGGGGKTIKPKSKAVASR
jgi:hypothetical protein